MTGVSYQIIGDDAQLVEIELQPGDMIRGEAGAMIYMDDGIEMQTMNDDGIFRGCKSMTSGEGFCITSFVHNGRRRGRMAFGAPYPGKIISLDLGTVGGSFLCQKDSFLCTVRGVDVEPYYAKHVGPGVYGGEGFYLHRVSGNGMVFLHAGGSIIQRDLQANESIRTDAGCLVAFSAAISFEVEFLAGFPNAMFGEEGVNLARLTGPGQVYLQSLPLSRIADRVFAATHTRMVEEQFR